MDEAEEIQRRTPGLLALDERIRKLEERAIADDGLHLTLQKQDGLTAAAVQELTRSINDPKTGLIVELDKFRAEVIADRAQFRSWIRGATGALSVVVTIATIVAPWIRQLIEAVVR